MNRGQSAGKIRNLSRDVVVSGGLTEWTADGPLMESGQSAIELEFHPETLLVLVSLQRCTADSPQYSFKFT